MQYLCDADIERFQGLSRIDEILETACERGDGTLFEHEAYEVFDAIGIQSPCWQFFKAGVAKEELREKLSNKTYVAKVVLMGATHKTEIDGIRFDVSVENAFDIISDFHGRIENIEGVLFVEQKEYKCSLGSELLLGMYQDPFFGPCLAAGFGGTSTENYKELMKSGCAQIFLPASIDLGKSKDLLKDLPILKYLEGDVRGTSRVLSFQKFLDVLKNLQMLARYYSSDNPDTKFIIEEAEINPAIAVDGDILALDGVVRVRRGGSRNLPSKPITRIANLLEPKSVAIVGASGKNRANPSNIILSKFLKSKMPRESIYLVHPKEEEIDGIKCHDDIAALLAARGGEPVDCFIVGVPAKIAAPLVADGLDKYAAKSYQIISAGFGETKAGVKIQDELKAKLDSLDPDRRPVINGPNTLGNIYHDTQTLFTPKYKSSGTGKGSGGAALICQSGAFMITRISDLGNIVAPKVSISVGNQMDLSVVDFLEFLIDEDGLRCYGLYIEGLNEGDGLRLMKLIEAARENGRFVVIYKSGRTEAGMEAAKGHTAAMAGDYEMFYDFMTKAGALIADTYEEFNSLMMLCTYCEGLSELNNKDEIGVAGLSNAGFEKCAIADHLTATKSKKFGIASLNEKTRARLQDIFTAYGISSIIDQGDILDLSPMMNDEGYDAIIRATLDDGAVDIGIYSIVPETVMMNTCEKGERHREDMMAEGGILSRLIDIKKGAKKPFVVSFESGWKYNAFAKRLLEEGIPTFRSVDEAARTVAKCLRIL
ncbi:MAG: hypothetical protein HN337_05300 [Deltaproteobacteria bacterium]|nr:hypothetical protein [Deltaproteobacteria bacterium]